MNQIILSGRLTRDPEEKQTQNSALTVFSIAVPRRFKSEGQPEADFFQISVWGKNAENCARYLVKGQQVIVRGRIQNRSYEDKNGDKRQITDIIADDVEFGAKPGGAPNYGTDKPENREPKNTAPENYYDESDFEPIDDDKLPF